MGAKSKKKVKDMSELTKGYEEFVQLKGEKEVSKKQMEEAIKKASKKPAKDQKK